MPILFSSQLTIFMYTYHFHFLFEVFLVSLLLFPRLQSSFSTCTILRCILGAHNAQCSRYHWRIDPVRRKHLPEQHKNNNNTTVIACRGETKQIIATVRGTLNNMTTFD